MPDPGWRTKPDLTKKNDSVLECTYSFTCRCDFCQQHYSDYLSSQGGE